MMAVLPRSAAPTVRPITFPWLGQAVLALALITYPLVATPFFTFQIGAYVLVLGTIALSLMFLAGYGGMVSLAQMTIAGVAGYMIAIFGTNSAGLGLSWPWYATVPTAIAIATIASVLIGWIAVRTEGIYTIMITLAIAVAFFYFAQQNYVVFNGFTGFAGLAPPHLFGLDWRAPVPFYYLALAVAAVAYAVVLYISRSTFGLSLQAIRDNPRRMAALGFDVKLHRITAYAIAGMIAACAGVLMVWFNGRISPGTIAVDPVISILVIAVLGGIGRPIGPFLGALVYVLLENFAIDLIDRERFNLVIGLAFLSIVLFSPDGILGLYERLKTRVVREPGERPGGV
jgi:branched-chain amino acid transport system permease protein